MDKPKPITELLHHASFPAEDVLQRGQFLHHLNNLIGTLLDPDARLHCQLGNIRDGLLILYTDSTAWASRLRYQTPTLLKQLQQHKGLESLQKVEVKVLPEEKKDVKNQKIALSSGASSCISTFANGIEDENLRNALKHLAAHHKEKN